MASNSNSLFLLIIIALKTRKLSMVNNYSKTSLSFGCLIPFSTYSANYSSFINKSFIMVSTKFAMRFLNFLWRLIYSNLFSSSSSKTMQFPSINSEIAIFQIGDVKYYKIDSYIQFYNRTIIKLIHLIFFVVIVAIVH